jgi:CheY-like chemotaxis protein
MLKQLLAACCGIALLAASEAGAHHSTAAIYDSSRTIDVQSEAGEGTTFTVYLPRSPDAAAGLPNQPTEVPAQGRETILIAEDEDTIRKVMVKILQSGGYRTLVACDGLDAVRLLREANETVHLVLLDVVMPRLDGPETWERMQRIRSGLSVLFTSGYVDDRYLARLPPGADVVEKPFRAKALLATVRKKLDEALPTPRPGNDES